MKDGIPLIYWTFRTCWSVVHLVLVALAVIALLVWSFTDNNAQRLLDSALYDLMEMQSAVASFIPWPWDS
ncbi:MAG: hypothetical protein QM621_09705 [Aeromicrobium sp.]|uniref:hypothetical protein n=1 Tax=Aeromicrobium sp. TaxID=1871063 RepID=UPI0039E3D7E2